MEGEVKTFNPYRRAAVEALLGMSVEEVIQTPLQKEEGTN